MSLYLDASVLVPLFVDESQSALLDRWIAGATAPLMVSDLAASEFAAVISRFIRKGEIGEPAAGSIHLAFDAWRREVAESVENLPTDVRAAARLVRTPFPKLLSPDAIHLATCQRLDATLVTHDRKLLEIAGREGIKTLCPAQP